MQKSFICSLSFALCLCSKLLLAAGIESPTFNIDVLKMVAQQQSIDFESLEYRDENNSEISVEAFVGIMQQGNSFTIQKNKQSAGEKVSAIFKIRSKQEIANSNRVIDNVDSTLIGAQLIEFNLDLLSGSQLKSSTLAGKPSFISFYFAACAPCIKEVPVLNELRKKAQDKVNFVAITFDSKQEAADFSTKWGFEWDPVIDAADYIQELNIPGFPTILLADETGNSEH